MQQKPNEKDRYNGNQFLFENDEARRREFELATAYFDLYPDQIKIRRKKDWKHVIKVLGKERPDLVPNVTSELKNIPKHSFINKSGEILALGSFIARGGFGRVKNSMNKDGRILVEKIETRFKAEQKETEVLEDIGFLTTKKMTRKVNTSRRKYYTGMMHLGKDLLDTLTKGKLNFDKSVTVARKAAWKLHCLHDGTASLSHISYAHGDIKPENIMLQDNGRVELTDFGMTENINTQIIEFKGTRRYLPSQYETESEAPILERMNLLGRKGTDIIAFKRTFSVMFMFKKNYRKLNKNILDMLTTDPIEEKIQGVIDGKDTALNINMAFTEQEMHLTQNSLVNLPVATKQWIGDCFAELDKLEELSYKRNDSNKIKQNNNKLKDLIISISITNSSSNNNKQLLNDIKKQSSSYEETLEKELFDKTKKYMKAEINTLKDSFKENDTQATIFFKDQMDKLNAAKTNKDLSEINKTLTTALKNNTSKQMQDINKKIAFFLKKAESSFIPKSIKDESLAKANMLQQAVYNVPLLERDNVFSKHENVQKALAYNRITNKHANVNNDIDEKIAAKSFHEFKKKYTIQKDVDKSKDNESDNTIKSPITPKFT